jgi:FkbM family methyltransferase
MNLSDSCQIAHLEDIYDKCIPKNSELFFVDVGAYDGYTFSNTYGLSKSGWRGLLIEPDPESMNACRWLYRDDPSVKFLEACIGASYGEKTLYRQGPNSTISTRTIETIPGYTANNKIIRKIYPLNMALLSNEVPKGFALLSIDVEGAEMDVLSEFSWKLWKPKMIIIEINVNGINLVKEPIEAWFSKTPYKLYQSDGLNNIYLLEES